MPQGIGEAEKEKILAIVEANGQAANVPAAKLVQMLKDARDRMERGPVVP